VVSDIERVVNKLLGEEGRIPFAPKTDVYLIRGGLETILSALQELHGELGKELTPSQIAFLGEQLVKWSEAVRSTGEDLMKATD